MLLSNSKTIRSDCDCVYGKVARCLVQYGERQRPEHKSIGLLIYAQIADAPRTVPPAVPYTHLQTAKGLAPITLENERAPAIGNDIRLCLPHS
jgi:hypothetical protein